MSDESDAFLDGAGLLGRPLSVGKDPPCLLKQNPNDNVHCPWSHAHCALDIGGHGNIVVIMCR